MNERDIGRISQLKIFTSIAIALSVAGFIALTIDSVSDSELKSSLFYAKLAGMIIGWMVFTLGIFFFVSTDLTSIGTNLFDRTRVYAAVYMGLGASMLLITSRFVIREYPEWIVYEVLGYFGFGVVAVGFFIHIVGTWDEVDTPLNQKSKDEYKTEN